MYLGLDLGTSGVKALLIDAQQNIVATADAALEVSRPQSGWSEQNPADWIAACRSVLQDLKSEHAAALGAVKAIGLSGQMHGAILLDSADKVLRPCILWNDTRAHLEAARLDAEPMFRDISGNIVFPGFTAPKLSWVSHNEPDIFSKTAKVLLPKDYLRLWLTGEHVSEMSDASGTGWLDVGAREWSGALLQAAGMTVDQMPRLVEGTEISGCLRRELADEWGMQAGIPIAGGAGDNAASAVGMGVIGNGTAFISLGTSGVLFAANASFRPDPDSAVHAFCHAIPDTWHQMGVILSATDALNWYAGITGSSVRQLMAEIGERPAAPAGLSFLPYLSGERTPHNDAAIRGAFIGLDRADGRPALTRAVLEGISFALRDCLEALNRAGTRIGAMTAVGGGTQSTYWLCLLATVLGLRIDLPGEGEFGAAFGAARLGLIAATGADPGEICSPPDIRQSLEPDPSLQDAFEAAYQRYRALYPAMTGVPPMSTGFFWQD